MTTDNCWIVRIFDVTAIKNVREKFDKIRFFAIGMNICNDKIKNDVFIT